MNPRTHASTASPMDTSQTTPSNTPDLETRDMLLNIGPAHPAMHGIIRIVAELDGEQIRNAEVEIGYLHRGFEKMAEVVDYNGVVPYTDRLNYVSPLINNMGYCMTVEKLLGISVRSAAITYGSSSRRFPGSRTTSLAWERPPWSWEPLASFST